jgi:hypothetical protein
MFRFKLNSSVPCKPACYLITYWHQSVEVDAHPNAVGNPTGLQHTNSRGNTSASRRLKDAEVMHCLQLLPLLPLVPLLPPPPLLLLLLLPPPLMLHSQVLQGAAMLGALAAC